MKKNPLSILEKWMKKDIQERLERLKEIEDRQKIPADYFKPTYYTCRDNEGTMFY